MELLRGRLVFPVLAPGPSPFLVLTARLLTPLAVFTGRQAKGAGEGPGEARLRGKIADQGDLGERRLALGQQFLRSLETAFAHDSMGALPDGSAERPGTSEIG